jgi:hypothetical protein
MIYSLNIGGVKRWASLSNNSLHSKSFDEPKIEEKNDKSLQVVTKKAAAVMPWWTSQSMALRLLNPSVAESELREYRHYLHQFSPNDIVLTPAASQESLKETHPDLKVFSSYTNVMDECLNQTEWTMSQMDQEIYQNYVNSTVKETMHAEVKHGWSN